MTGGGTLTTVDELELRGVGAVVATVRGLDSDRLVVPQAAAAAVRERVRLLVLHVAEGRLPDGVADAVLAEAAVLAREHAPDLAVETLAPVGDPVDVLVRVSAHARRLYVGTAETGGVRRVNPRLLTSTVSRLARCPVFMVRGAWTGRTTRGARVLAYLAAAAEQDVVAFAEHEARSLGISLTILYVASIGEPWPVAADVPSTRVLEPDPDRAHRAVGSPRNEVVVISSSDLEAIRAAEGVQVVRARYADTARLVAVVPDGS